MAKKENKGLLHPDNLAYGLRSVLGALDNSDQMANQGPVNRSFAEEAEGRRRDKPVAPNNALNAKIEARSPAAREAQGRRDDIDRMAFVGTATNEMPEDVLDKLNPNGAIQFTEEEMALQRGGVSPQEVEEVVQTADEATKVVRMQAEESAKDSNPGSLQSKLAESLKYFAPDLIGGVVGSLFGGTEAGLAGMQAGADIRGGLDQREIQLSKLNLQEKQGDRRLDQGDRALEQREDQFKQMRGLKMADLALKKQKTLGDGPKLTVAQEAVDKAFGKNYAEMITSGKTQNIERNIQQLDDAIGILQGASNATGSLAGAVPEWLARRLGGSGVKKGLKARDYVKEVVQQNLKEILGGQFSEKEAQELMDRAFDRDFSEEENIKRISRLKNQVRAAAAANKKATQYYETHGTLRGYDGQVFRTASQFDLSGDSDVKKDPTEGMTKRQELEYRRSQRGR